MQHITSSVDASVFGGTSLRVSIKQRLDNEIIDPENNIDLNYDDTHVTRIGTIKS